MISITKRFKLLLCIEMVLICVFTLAVLGEVNSICIPQHLRIK